MAEGDDGFMERFEAAKRASVGQLLFRCARLFNEQALAVIRERAGQPSLRSAHTTLLPHIEFGGTRLTDLASKLGISKQAVGQLVGELVEMEVLERIPDPSDGRAKLIRFSSKGRAGLFDGLSVLMGLDESLKEAIGAEHMASLRASLRVLMDELDRRESGRDPAGD